MHIISSSETRTKDHKQKNQKGGDSTDAILKFQLLLASVQVKTQIINRFRF